MGHYHDGGIGKAGGGVSLYAVSLERAEVNAYVERLHRHHAPTIGDKFRLGCAKDGKLVGVIQVGRPVARALDDGKTLEVLRCCTDGTPHACSFLYGAAARIARELGYAKIVTYILDTEPGTSLKAAGWHKEAEIRGKSWSCPSRPRRTAAPQCNKQRWAKELERRVAVINAEID